MNCKTITAFGCRAPDSKGLGFWDGAFVYVDTTLASKTAKFIRGCDYVGDLSFDTAKTMYDKLLADGWSKMSKEDITKTSGVEICETTVIPF